MKQDLFAIQFLEIDKNLMNVILLCLAFLCPLPLPLPLV